MPLSFRSAFRAFVAALGLLPVSAHAASARGVSTGVEAYAGQAGGAVLAFAQAVMAGELASIQKVGFAVSGLVALIGLRLLIVRPRQIDHQDERPEAIEADTAKTDSGTDRPVRLLDAIAAAKAQMSIDEADRP